jgi:hypothetical protein
VIPQKNKQPLYRIHFDDGTYTVMEQDVISSITDVKLKSPKKENSSEHYQLPKKKKEQETKDKDEVKQDHKEEEVMEDRQDLSWKHMWQIFRTILEFKDDK